MANLDRRVQRLESTMNNDARHHVPIDQLCREIGELAEHPRISESGKAKLRDLQQSGPPHDIRQKIRQVLLKERDYIDMLRDQALKRHQLELSTVADVLPRPA